MQTSAVALSGAVPKPHCTADSGLAGWTWCGTDQVRFCWAAVGWHQGREGKRPMEQFVGGVAEGKHCLLPKPLLQSFFFFSLNNFRAVSALLQECTGALRNSRAGGCGCVCSWVQCNGDDTSSSATPNLHPSLHTRFRGWLVCQLVLSLLLLGFTYHELLVAVLGWDRL